MTFIDFQRLYF